MTTVEEFREMLSTIEEDRMLVLTNVRALRGTLDRLVEQEENPPQQILDRLREANEFFATIFAAHLLEQERTLFPFLAKHSPGGVDVVAVLQQDRAKISRLREEFGNCLQIAFELEDAPHRQVLRDLLIGGWELLEAIDRHAEAETRAVLHCPNSESIAPPT
jgi:hypothetical protein